MRQRTRRFGTYGPVAMALLLVVTALAALAGTGGTRQAVAQDIQTRVQILHAATQLGKIEVSLNDDEVADEFEYGEQTDWIELEPGSVQVWITYDRAGINYTAFNVVYPVPAGNDYTLVITDVLIMGGSIDRSPLPDDMARVRFTHASVDTPAINVVSTGDLALATQLGYGRSSDYIEVPAGTYDTEVRLADTGEVLLSIPGGVVEGGMSYDFFLIGEPGGDDEPLEARSIVSETTERDPGSTPPA